MTVLDWTFVAEVFADALEQAEEERAMLLDARCAGRPAERAAVERMLAARRNAAAGFLAGLDPALLDDLGSAVETLSAIGPWRIVHEIGRGGMGQVFLAERADGHFDQRVAIKLLKRGMDSDAILARFLRERQILAGLDHPNIARLMDGGIAEDGRPYFVMEYVDGLPITEFADGRRLTIDVRLRLFATVCDAVEYAHRNLVVHRDLKPSNILVTHDGRVKLLDFGIAKLLNADGPAAHETLTTEGVRLMTPAFAAPEQFHGGAITTSTDVYGLGAVLYLLLAGRAPFVRESDDRERTRDAEPLSIISAVERAAGGAPAMATARATDPDRLRRRLAGDLETIVAHAMRAAPERRYASVGALKEDLRRHEEQLPVRARPETLTYRISRFVRRHRTGVLVAAAVALLITTFAITATLQARALAVERDRAQREATAAREVSEFLVGVFEVSDPLTTGESRNARASDLLARGADQIETDLAGQPDLQARLLTVIGRAFANLQQGDQAEPVLARAVELQRTAAADGPAVVAALQLLARARIWQGDFPQADSTLREAIAIQQEIGPVGRAMWSLLVDLADVHHGSGDYEGGAAAIADAIELFRRLPTDSMGESLYDLRRMADMLGFSREHTFTDSVYSRLLAVEREVSGDSSEAVALALRGWARSFRWRGQTATADSLFGPAIELHRKLDPTSVGTGTALTERAGLALALHDTARADSLVREGIAILVARLGPDDRTVASVRNLLADILDRPGHLEESIAVRRDVAARFAADANDAVILLPSVEWDLANTLRRAGRLDESLDTYERSMRRFEAGFPPHYLLTAQMRGDYGAALVEAGRPAEAEAMLRDAIDVLAARWGEHDMRVDDARITLGVALFELQRETEARDLLREVHARLQATPGENHDTTKRARAALDRIEDARARTSGR